ncbi:MAG: TfoX/Sxy family protein [Rikenellaceae bacterium]|nr:TfoX/Sxy family protein [Rikenellaceae bacterium]
MACNLEFIEFVQTQLESLNLGTVLMRKMFGDYTIYINGIAVAVACDNCVYIKPHTAIDTLMSDAERGIPYPGAKERYILDVGHKTHTEQVLQTLLDVLPPPKTK